MNYAEALEQEAHDLARRKLIRAAEGTSSEDKLPGWLDTLDAIHAENMALAAQWTQPRTRNLPPLTEANVSSEAVQQVAINRVAEAQEDQS